MAGKVHTDSEALYAVRGAIIRFADDFQNSQSNFANCFERLNNQIGDYIRSTENKLDVLSEEKSKVDCQLEELEEQKRIVDNQINQMNDGRTDSFACDTCPTRMMLKVMGDTTPCKSSGCNGTMHRVFNNSERHKYQVTNGQISEKIKYLLQQKEDLQKQISNLESEQKECINLNNEFHKQQDVIMAMMALDSNVDTDSTISFIDNAIKNLVDYQSVTFDIDAEGEKKKTR